MAMKSSSRNGASILWIVGHSAEGARNKEDLRVFFNRDTTQASSHVGIDGGGVAVYVDDSRAAWTLRGGNAVSLNAELCGFARWSRAQWLSEGIVDGVRNPRLMITHFALWVKSKCEQYGIPKVKLSPADVAANRPGIIGHWDYTRGKRDGTHTDPGVNFPWDYVMHIVNGGGVSQEDEVSWDENLTHQGHTYKARDWMVRTNEAAWLAANAAAANGVKIDAMRGELSNDEAVILAAIREEPTQVLLTEEQELRLLNGIEDASARSLYKALAAKYGPEATS